MQWSQFTRYAKPFGFATVTTLAVLTLVGVYLGAEAALIATLLVVLEVTLSFDNAVINARILVRMSRFWQQIFLTIGILVAVFGMRIVFPIVLVAVTTGLPATDILHLALNDPERYSSYLEEAGPIISAFGGTFLLLVCLSFFILENNKPHWWSAAETTMRRLPERWFVAPALALGLLLVLAWATSAAFATVLTAGLIGIATFILMHGAVRYMQRRHLDTGTAKLTGFGGLVAFLYLEVLDASFSLDGVIGAFAITSSVVLIAAGLGVGALWVRSMTIFLVRHGTLGKYKYLEQGAHYAIGVLAAVLLAGLFVHIPEVITGLVGLTIIVSAVISSRRAPPHHSLKGV